MGIDLFGGSQPQGGNDLLGGLMGDTFGSVQQPSMAPFPSFIAYEDSVIKIGFTLKREMPGSNSFNLTA